MAKATDILLDDDMDYQISSTGDFTIGESDQQSAILVLNTNQGSWKFHPICGMGISKYEGSSGTQAVMKREMSVQLQADGFKIKSIIVKDYSEFYLDINRDI